MSDEMDMLNQVDFKRQSGLPIGYFDEEHPSLLWWVALVTVVLAVSAILLYYA